MLMGSVCTRACRFCAVDTGNPKGWLDADEPRNAAEAVRLMALRYIVLTSVDRDDLDDGGAAHYAACIRAIKAVNPTTAIEALTPDFNGDPRAVETVVDAPLSVFAQNVETVERLTHPVRDPRAGYAQTLGVLEHAKRRRNDVLTKTSLMLGLGETDDEIRTTMDDLARARRRPADARPVSATDAESPEGRALGASRRVRALSRMGTRARLRRSCIGSARAVELSRRSDSRKKQPRIGELRRRSRSR